MVAQLVLVGEEEVLQGVVVEEVLQAKVVLVEHQASQVIVAVVVEEELLLEVEVVEEEEEVVVGRVLHLGVEVVEVGLELQMELPVLEVAGFLFPVP